MTGDQGCGLDADGCPIACQQADWYFAVEQTSVSPSQVTYDIYFWSDGTPVQIDNFDFFMQIDETELAFNNQVNHYEACGGFPPACQPGVVACGGAGVYNPVSGMFSYERYTGYTDMGLSLCDEDLGGGMFAGKLASVTFDILPAAVVDGEDDYGWDLTQGGMCGPGLPDPDGCMTTQELDAAGYLIVTGGDI